MLNFYKKYLLPGFVFQSIVIGGGYGTGRELVEFFLSEGPAGGYLGMLVATVIWGVILALSFELARLGRHYDYRTFLSALLGRGWMAFEVLYVLSVILTTAVVGSASGELLNETMNWPRIVGTLILMSLVGLFAYSGSSLIEKFFSVWSMGLYIVYFIVIVLVVRESGDAILSNMTVWKEGSAWLVGGLKYAAYNLAALPAMLFALRHLERRREAFGAGMLAGVIAMVPGMLIYTAFLANYPAIAEEAIPANSVLTGLGIPWFQTFFQIILFGTFIETGTGMIHGFNERIAGVMQEHGRTMSRLQRLGVAAGVLVAAIWMADRFGLVKLISDGYGLITYGFWILFLLPILVVGSRKIFAGGGGANAK
jgi:uncharacterized membrane protein YkvI